MPSFSGVFATFLTSQAASIRCRGDLRSSRGFGGPWANLGSVGTLDMQSCAGGEK